MNKFFNSESKILKFNKLQNGEKVHINDVYEESKLQTEMNWIRRIKYLVIIFVLSLNSKVLWNVLRKEYFQRLYLY